MSFSKDKSFGDSGIKSLISVRGISVSAKAASASAKPQRDGFTLVELLIVIAILAILAAAVVIIINPGEMMAEARDGQRTSEIKSVSDALNLFVLDNPGVSLGTYKKVYISLPSATAPACDTTGLPTLPTGWTYNCVTATNLRNIDSTGWLPINLTSIKGGSPISNLPTDPTNTKDSFYSYIPGQSQTYSVSAEAESIKSKQSSQSVLSGSFSQGTAPGLSAISTGGDWIKVPGSSTFGTTDFEVMKYEPKCLNASGTPLTSPTDSAYETYYDSSAPCTAANNRYISSQKDGFVITRISHDTAKTYCTSIGAHLITNEEWMTIARNIEQVSSNWSGGSVGNGFLYSGHNDDTPSKALSAGPDASPYVNTENTSGNQRRTLALSNGEVIWDLSGNLREHVQRTSSDIQTAIATPTCSTGTGWQWCNYDTATSPYISAYSTDVVQNQISPSNLTWTAATNRVGRVYTNSGAAGGTIFTRGGAWDYGSYAGVFELQMDLSGSSTSGSIGFRCAR